MYVSISPRAAKYMRQMVRFAEGSASAGFRLTARPGGRTGIEASFTVEEKPCSGDTVVEQNGALLFMAAATRDLLQGCTIDCQASALTFLDLATAGAGTCAAGNGWPPVGVPVVTIRPLAAWR
jgi:Fe-S cluster assembly iron-binding protein IscA